MLTNEAKVLLALMKGPQTTFDLRAKGICSTGQAISRLREQLKRQGYCIKTQRCSCVDEAGVEHHGVARYYLCKCACQMVDNTVSAKQTNAHRYQHAQLRLI